MAVGSSAFHLQAHVVICELSVFLLALGVSVVLQSIERFINPSGIEEPILIMVIGAAGVGSNILMLAIIGGSFALPASPLYGGLFIVGLQKVTPMITVMLSLQLVKKIQETL